MVTDILELGGGERALYFGNGMDCQGSSLMPKWVFTTLVTEYTSQEHQLPIVGRCKCGFYIGLIDIFPSDGPQRKSASSSIKMSGQDILYDMCEACI